jgi:glycine cleavage system H lipoate-binding protein
LIALARRHRPWLLPSHADVNAFPSWLFQMKVKDNSELATLLDEAAYKALTTAEEAR